MGNQSHGTLLVTGASGQLGRRVVQLLSSGEQSQSQRIIALTRSPDKLADLAARGVELRAGDFDRPDTLQAAFRGADRILIVSTDALDRPGRRLEQHLGAVKAAKAAGASHVLYTSLTHPEPDSPISLAPDHWGTEQAIAHTFDSYTVLRNNLYMDHLLLGLPRAIQAGKLVNAYGEGAVGYVTREDCARAAAAALASGFDGKAVLDITGPAAVTQTELARLCSELCGVPLEYVAVDAQTATENALAAGVPAAFAELLVSFETAGRRGQLAVASSAVLELSGRAPTSVREFLNANRAAFP